MSKLPAHQTNEAFTVSYIHIYKYTGSKEDRERRKWDKERGREAGNLPNVLFQNSFKDNQLNS